jgi:hypothetical protein
LGPEVAFFHPKVFPVILPAAPYLGFLEPDLFPIVSEASTSCGRWRMVGAGDIRRWRMIGAGEEKALEKERGWRRKGC